MNTEETKGKGDKAGCSGFGDSSACFERMVEMMSKCCVGQDGSMGCSVMGDKMMNAMMEMCRGTKADNTGSDHEGDKV